MYRDDRELGDGPEPGDQFGSAPMALDEPSHHRSGPALTEAQHRERGRVQLKVRITDEQRRRLAWIQDEDGHDLATIIGTYIDTEYEERNPR
jgi:hypothetical protein